MNASEMIDSRNNSNVENWAACMAELEALADEAIKSVWIDNYFESRKAKMSLMSKHEIKRKRSQEFFIKLS